MRSVIRSARKVSAALAVVFLMLLAQEARAQITVKGNGITIEQAIRQVERTSDYSFFYNAGDLSGIDPKNVDVTGNIENILSALFRGTGIIYRIQGKEIVLKKVAPSQQAPVHDGRHTVKGVVTDAMDGQPIIGAGVLLRGTTSGTFTDIDGRFSIEVPQDAVLEFSFLSYETIIETVAGRATINIEMTPRLNLLNEVVMMGYSSTKKTELSSSVATLQGETPWDNPHDQNTGEYLLVNNGTRSDNGKQWYSHDKFNIFHNEIYNSSKSDWHDLTTDMQLVWRITNNLSFTSTNRYGSSASTWKLVIDPRTASASWPEGVIQKNITTGRSFSTSNLLKYTQTIGNGHNINALAGWEWGKWKNDYTNAEGIGMKSGLTVLNAASPNGVGGYYIEGEGWSVFGQAQYSYMEKYIVTASLRADANSVFAPKQRVGYFPSVSTAWLASSEDFIRAVPAITFLKLRASYGETGNSGIQPYSYLSTYAAEAAVQYQGVVGMYPAKQENPYLHWERARMTNIGLDLTLLDRVEFTLDLYNIKNDELLLDVPTAPSTGFSYITKNSGAIRNQGIEFSVNSTNIKKKNFTWTTGFNIGFNRNTVISIPNHEDIIQTVGSNSARQIIRESEALYSWYMPKWMGVDPETGDPQWEHLIKDENGNVTGTELTNVFDPDNDSQIVGKASPLFSGGLVNTFTLGGFSLAVNLNYVYGNKIFNYTRVTMDTDGHYTDYNQMSINNGLGWTRWTEPGDIATHPRPVSGGNHNADGISSRYLEDGSFLRVKNVTLSYALPQRFASKIHMKEAKIFLSGDNLFTLSRFSGMDPEVRLESTMYELAGMYSMNYPVGRSVSLGLNLKF